MIWAHYLLQVNLYLLLFYCFYKLLLEKETYFMFNRVFLVGSGILSLVIPFLRIEWFTKQEATKQIYSGVDQLNNIVISLVEDPVLPQQFNWGKFLVVIYLVGICVLIVRFITQLVLLNIAIHFPQNGAAFSFFNIKQVDNNLPSANVIDAHEDLHVKQFHSFDILFFEFLTILIWFNPIVYFYKSAVKNIHEYLADQEAIKVQGNKDAYSLLLLSNAFNVNSQILTNSFYTKSMVKKRIYMLYKQRSKKSAILKYGLFVPLFGFALVLSSSTVRNNVQLREVANSIPIDISVMESVLPSLKRIHPSPIPHAISWTNNINPSSEKVERPVHINIELLKSNLLSEKTQNESKTFILKGVEGDAADKEPMLILNGIPQKRPSDNLFDISGNNISTINLLKNETAVLKYGPEAKEGVIEVTTNDYTNNEVTTSTASSPSLMVAAEPINRPASYPGGINKLRDHISKNLNYPAGALAANKTGIVIVDFIIDKDGTISNIHVNKKLGFGLDEAAMHVISTLDFWKPKMINGKAVKAAYNIPIKFELK